MLAGLCVLVRHPVKALRGSVARVRPLGGEGAAEAAEISHRSLERVAAVTAIAAGVAALVAIAARTEFFANDDTYIYFNYAKNFVAGRPFAYDPRNIASEGFTSAIYLLLLVPFEAAGINMMFAAVILNLAAIALIFYLGFRVLRADRVLEGGFLLIAVSLFALFMARDTNIPTIVGRGLETMLGPASVLWAILHLARVHQADDEATRRRAVTMFLVASFLSFLIRPENIVLLAAAGVLLLVAMWRRGQLAALLARLGMFVAALAVYFSGKLLLFGDLMQTSYYRKMRADGAGTEYVLGALADYWRWILYAVVLAVCAAGLVAVAPARARVEYVQAPCAAIVRAGACRGRGWDLDGVPALGATDRLRLSLSGQFLCLPVSDRRGGSCISAVARDPADREDVLSTQGQSSRVWCRCCGRGRLRRGTPGPEQSSSVSACIRRRKNRRRNTSTFASASFSAIESPTSKS